jgi:hypothetical protein
MHIKRKQTNEKVSSAFLSSRADSTIRENISGGNRGPFSWRLNVNIPLKVLKSELAHPMYFLLKRRNFILLDCDFVLLCCHACL